MNKAALDVYQTLRRDGHAELRSLDAMQTRTELYDYLGYHALRAEARPLVRRARER